MENPNSLHFQDFWTSDVGGRPWEFSDVLYSFTALQLFKALWGIRQKIRFWRLGGSGGAFYCKIKTLITPKLCRIILLHFGLITFRFHFGKSEQSSFFWFLDLVDMTMGPHTNYSWFYNSRKYRTSFVFFLEIWESRKWTFQKRRVPNKPGDPSKNFLENLSMWSISIKNMKWQFGNFQLNELKHLHFFN